MKTLICLIGGQLAPNLFSVIYYKPDKVILIHTEESLNDAKHFEDYLKTRNHIEHVEFVCIDAFDNQIIFNSMNTVFDKNKNDTLLLNYTGGTKQMSSWAFALAKEFNIEQSYFDTQNEYIHLVKGNELQKKDLNIQLSISDYLALSSTKVSGSTDTKAMEPLSLLSEYLFVHRTNKHHDINKVLDKAVKAQLTKNVLKVDYETDDNSFSITTSKDEKVIVHFREIEFQIKKNDWWKQYLGGGWFEHYLFLRLQKLEVFDDLKLNLKILPNSTSKTQNQNFKFIKNEFDIIGVNAGVPLLFECKSGKVTIENLNNLKSSLDNYLPKYSVGVLVSLYPITNPNIKEKCIDYGIELLEGKESIQKNLELIVNKLVVKR